MITGIDHLYVETPEWDAALGFWRQLGFEVAQRWGSEGHRAGRLVSGTAAVVLAETARDAGPPAFVVHFALSDADTFAPGPSVEVVTPLEATHWGTRWLRVADPDERIHVLEEGA